MYAVNYTNRVSSNTIKELPTLDEAITYANKRLEGYEPFDGNDDDRISWCKCEIFDLAKPDDCEGDLAVYETELFWEKD